MRSSKPSKRADSSVRLLLSGKLLDDRLVELPPLRGKRHDAVLGNAAVDGVQRGRDNVHAKHHARAAAVRLVVDLAALERREVPVVEKPQVKPGPEHRGHRAALGEPSEGGGDEGEDVELHEAC